MSSPLRNLLRATSAGVGILAALACLPARAGADDRPAAALAPRSPEIAVPPAAFAEGATDAGEPRVEARLLLHPDDPPAGPTRRLGVLLDVEPGWHVYWKHSGDSGAPTTLHWDVDGARLGPVHWPAPRVFREGEEPDAFVTYGYEGRVLLAAEARFDAPPDAEAGASRHARVDVELLACRHACVPGRFSLSRTLDPVAGPEAAHSRAVFARFAPEAATAGRGAPAPGLLRALALAFLGGLVLNLMPCVLPVLAIKVFALAELAHAGRRRALAHGLAYTAGVLVSMLALAAAVAALRAAGTAVGWGFQFQEPLFVAAIAALLVVFALNLFGVFEIGVDTARLASLGRSAAGARRSFFEGLLAVALATPCSAPFLGTAVGFAFASPAPLIAAIFAAVGLGLAAPFALVALVPAWARLVPRSGAWMLQLRSALGFALLASVVWLLWVAGRSVGADGLVALLAFLLVVAFGTWLYGRLQALPERPGLRGAGLAFAALALLGLGAVRVELRDGPEPGPAQRALPSRAYDREAVRAELSRGRPVFVYFTADWCITCQVNERAVLAKPRVREALERHDAAVFVADWTHGDEEIRRELARFGRAGVPLYLLYRPAAPEDPEILPELLRVESVIGALRGAGDAAARRRG